MGWSFALDAERRARLEAKRIRDAHAPVLPVSSRRRSTAEQLDHLAYEIDRQRRAATSTAGTAPSPCPVSLAKGPRYRWIEPT